MRNHYLCWLVVYTQWHSLPWRYIGNEYLIRICRIICQGRFKALKSYDSSEDGNESFGYVFLDSGEWECNWLTTVAVSFVGTFGFLDIFMPKIWSAAYCLVYAIGIFGMFFCIRKQFFVSGKEEEVRRRRDKSATTLFITIRKSADGI